MLVLLMTAGKPGRLQKDPPQSISVGECERAIYLYAQFKYPTY
jgi:hypothetical protein